MDSSTITWDIDRKETFIIFNTEFDVQKAKKLITSKPRLVSNITVDNLKLIAAWPLIWPRVLNSANLQIPIIMITIGRGLFPIDGWHRIHKAIKTGIDSLPYVALSAAETIKVQIEPMSITKRQKNHG